MYICSVEWTLQSKNINLKPRMDKVVHPLKYGLFIMTLKESISRQYYVCPVGVLVCKATGKPLIFCKDERGYYKARVRCPEISKHKDKRIPMRLHRIIAMFFLKDFSENLQVNHIDFDKNNNCASNLEMVTNAQNAQHAWDWDKRNGGQRRLKLREKNIALDNAFAPKKGQLKLF